MDKTSLSGLDNFYLQIEKAWKLKTLSSVWIFDERLDSGFLHQTLDWLCDTYPKYASVPAHGSMFHTALWTRPIGWQPKMNIEHYRLKTPTREALEEYIADKVYVMHVMQQNSSIHTWIDCSSIHLFKTIMGITCHLWFGR